MRIGRFIRLSSHLAVTPERHRTVGMRGRPHQHIADRLPCLLPTESFIVAAHETVLVTYRNTQARCGCLYRIKTTGTAFKGSLGKPRPNLDGPSRAEQRVGDLIRQGPSRKFRRGRSDRDTSNPERSLCKNRAGLRFIVRPATMLKPDRSPISSSASTPLDGSVYTDSRGPASSPCIACSVLARGSVCTSAGG
jgi:hypothetical protein